MKSIAFIRPAARKRGVALLAVLCVLAAAAATYRPVAARGALNGPDAAGGAALPPAVISQVNTAEDWAALTAADGPGSQIALFRPDAQLNVGGFATVSQIVAALGDAVLPAFYVSDTQTALAFAGHAAAADLYDAYVVSDDPALIQAVKDVTGFLYGVVDYRGSAAPLPQMVTEVNTCGARTAWIDAADKASVQYLQYRWLNVWVSGGEEAVLCGANGVETDDAAAVCAFLSALPAGTMLRDPMIVGHRGLEKTMLENSVSGMLAAYEAGADAVECDIQVTKDDKLVVMHDESLQRTTNGTGNIADLTWDEIKNYVVDYPKAAGYREAIPLIDDFFQAIKGNGKVLVVELKTIDPRSVPLLKERIEHYGVADQIVLITFFAGQIGPARQQLAGVSLGNLSYKPTADDAAALYKDAATKNVTVNPNYGALDDAHAAALALRGFAVYPWTYADAAALGSAYYGGLHGLTTSDVRLAAGLLEDVEGGLTLREGAAVLPQVTAVTVGGERQTVAAEIVSAGFGYAETADGVTADAAGEYLATVRVAFSGLGKNFYLYKTVPVTVTAAPEPVDPEPEEPEPSGGTEGPDPSSGVTTPGKSHGCGGAASAALPVTGLTVPLLFGILLKYRGRKG